MSEKERNDAKKGEDKGKPGHGNRAEGEGSPKGKRILLRTFGCQMNVRDTEFISGLFMENGYELAASPEKADIILFNTCSVREHAEQRAISNMGFLMHKQKDRIYGIVGCGAQALKDSLFKRLPQLSIVCGTGEIAKLPELVEEARRGKVTALNSMDAPLPEVNPPYREKRKSAYVSIMRGCNNFCSYCIVPYVRGKERSRKAEGIIIEIRDLARRGIRDITLLGQNVNSYRGGTRNFTQLLKIVNDIDGIEKVRFLTSHPKDADITLFETMRDCDKVVKHLHLPLQSGSDRILRLMNRGYTAEDYLKLVDETRRTIPGLRLTTDIIVGFPTETEKDFGNTKSMMEGIKFGLAYIFKYSPRPRTKAAELKDDVPDGVKQRRHRVLLDLQKGISAKRKNEKGNCSCVSDTSLI